MQQETAQYRFLALLGEGGSARVYHAQRLTGDGFARDVAVKVLLDEHPSSEVLARLWTEAKLLGMVCDRAVVSVDAPLRLGDRYVVVMEHVDGVTLRALLEHGPLEPGVAAEIACELARALHSLSTTRDLAGELLEIVHRDIKPENLQLTPAGEVRLLDFGNARGRFGEPEPPSKALAGTPGYIAPERASGEDSPAGDVFALGVVLHEMVTGSRPLRPAIGNESDPRDIPEGVSDEVRQVIALAATLRAQQPSDRPSAREVERAARVLRHRLPGDWLQDWAEVHVPQQRALPPDERVGQIYPPTEGARRLSRWLPLSLASVLSAGMLLAALFAQLSPEGNKTSPTTALQSEPAPEEQSLSAPVPLPTPEPERLRPAPVPPSVPAAKSKARVVPVAVPAEVVPDPLPPQAVPASPVVSSYDVLIVSIPFGAHVELVETGEDLGQTPLRRSFPSGPHAIRLRSADGRASETTIAVGRSMPTRYVWKSAEDRWESGY